jgi:hypothetical protein
VAAWWRQGWRWIVECGGYIECSETMMTMYSLFDQMVKNQFFYSGKIYHFPTLNTTTYLRRQLGWRLSQESKWYKSMIKITHLICGSICPWKDDNNEHKLKTKTFARQKIKNYWSFLFSFFFSNFHIIKKVLKISSVFVYRQVVSTNVMQLNKIVLIIVTRQELSS